jgi:hypothetical protein
MINQNLVQEIMDKLTTGEINYTICEDMNKPQLITALMQRERVINDLRQLLNEAKL